MVAVMQSAMQSALDQISAGTGLLGLGILFPTIWYTSSHIETVHRLQTMDLAQTHIMIIDLIIIINSAASASIQH